MQQNQVKLEKRNEQCTTTINVIDYTRKITLGRDLNLS